MKPKEAAAQILTEMLARHIHAHLTTHRPDAVWPCVECQELAKAEIDAMLERKKQ